MDLRGMLNDNGPSASTPSKPPPPIQHAPPPPMPSTPVQTNSHQPFRDYSQTQPSPGRHISLDYGLQPAPPGAYASPPPPYQTPSGPYPNRPAPPPPPPLQQIAPNDLRSPSIASGPGPSPYRQTPTSSISAASGGYPFPPQQTPTSPVQRQQYPPLSAYHRDSFPQPSVPVGMTGPPGSVSYMQGQQVPQTPPVATPGGHAYPHQRSQSTHSTPTPTSAQSQHAQYGAPFVQGSPVATHHPLPQMEPQPHRPSSQPPTPVAAPLSRPGQTLNFSQPPSPYQQRGAATSYPHANAHNHISPPPPVASSLPPSLSRHPSSTIYDPLSQDPHRRSQSHGDRDRSISVSPKTRVPSLPTSADRPGTSISDSDPRHPYPSPAMNTITKPVLDAERAVTPAKRKLEDRELHLDELERREVRPPPFEDMNGRPPRPDIPHATIARVQSHQPQQPLQKKRRIYKNPPVWAQTLRGGQVPSNPNHTLYRPVQHGAPQINGKADSLSSRHASPEEKRAMPAPQQPAAGPPPPAVLEPNPLESLLGPWEPSITPEVPQSGITKAVADFLFQNILLHSDLNQIKSLGVNFEIEAKLGTLVDRHTGQRVNFGVMTECVVRDSSDLNFRSSMSEAQHQAYNQFLNSEVTQAYPLNKANQGRPRPRLEIKYKHRYEIDKFFELPPHVRDRTLPACVAMPLAARKHGAKVRVTHDARTNELLAKIVKARVADINIHFPEYTLDCRISINLEMDWNGSVAELEQMATATRTSPSRNKDRLSYKHGPYQIDLTQVTQVPQGPNNSRQDKEHELEIEVAPEVLIDQGNRVKEGKPHAYVELVEGFINNIRVLGREASNFSA
ncbi:CYTH-like domain-containing protein [Echria macrotheca]|uniref:mRNA-capping enzyme subunit beta n=1 Tax=Echria macrotheca TaxID=438768 RepID=A0AAJ0B780_9PEZI|nr:CYTH-like domain-containing protein [Echria macrotheca]